MSAADGLHAWFRQSEMFHLAFSDEILHGTRDILDRHVLVYAVLIEKIDSFGPEPLHGSLGDLLDMRRSAVQAALLAGFWIDVEAEFGGDHDLIAERLKRFAHDLLIGEWAVDFRGIEEGDAAFDSCTDQRDSRLLV